MLKKLFKKQYIYYATSIVFTRGLEIFVLFFAADYFSKEQYGSLEFYKKVIEVAASFFAFGFPALILSYTKSDQSKRYFYFLSILFIIVIGIAFIPFLYLLHWQILLIPFVFYAIFFTGGVTQSYILVLKGSEKASMYKIFISFLFYGLVLIAIYFYKVSSYAFVYPSYLLLALMSAWTINEYRKANIVLQTLKKYWKLFKKLLLSSFTLVVSNFANLMFLYTDIFIIKILSTSAEVDIADYSFSLNIANMLMLIPLTLVQVDIEKLKKSYKTIKELHQKIIILVGVSYVLLLIFYKLLISTYFEQYQNTFILFVIILTAKLFQSLSPLYGTYMVIRKKFVENLGVNIFMMLGNIILSYLLFFQFGLYGVAAASVISLIIRYVILRRMVAKIVRNM